MNKINSKQVNILKENIEKMAKSDEHFIFMIFKNENGTDNVIEYAYNMDTEKIKHYLKKASDSARIIDDGT